jgi:CheY-like chemotaxis protein
VDLEFPERASTSMRRILLIEDDRSIRTIITLQLTIMGYQVQVAEDGEEGLQLFMKSGNLDLVITDIRMPRKDGNEVAKQIRRSDRANMPIIAITAYKDELQMDLFNSWVIKPFRIHDLIGIIKYLEHFVPEESSRCPKRFNWLR